MAKIMNINKVTALVFFGLTIIFIVVSMTNQSFFDWVFERHHNQWSWYIRPVFLIPFCFFAYKHNWAGISITIFCLFTSMFWFSKPEMSTASVNMFLEFEKNWLSSDWDFNKVMFSFTVPLSFFALGLAFWKHSLSLGLVVIVLIALGKMAWSVGYAGDSGKSIIVPAIVGLSACLGFIYLGFKILKSDKTAKKQSKNSNDF
jgi:hypothetical protein